MNKLLRKQKVLSKFKKRLKNYGYTLADAFKPGYNLFCLKTTSRPCSCHICKKEKFKRKQKHKQLNLE